MADFGNDRMVYVGKLEGHGGAVTSIAASAEVPDTLVSSSRDKGLIVWKLTRETASDTGDINNVHYGVPQKFLHGHGHFVSDCALSSDGDFALSGSWDGTVRLWDLSTGESLLTRERKSHFKGHSKDVLTVAFSPDHRQIITGGRDHTLRLWNTLGQCKYVVGGESQKEDGHTDWVSCVRFSPNPEYQLFVSGGWDKVVKVWDLTNFKLVYNLVGHTGYVSTVTVSPDASLCASGGKDGVAMLWDLKEGKHLYSIEAGAPINSLCFSPDRYWLCAAVPERSNASGEPSESIIIWNLETKAIVDKISVDWGEQYKGKKATKPECTCVTWGDDGETLFAGYTDGVIRCWKIAA